MRRKKARTYLEDIGLIALTLYVIILITLTVSRGAALAQPAPNITENRIALDTLSLRQKIAQMVVTLGVEENAAELKQLGIGGVHLFALPSQDEFRRVVSSFQNGTPIPFFITADLEGCVSPFEAFIAYPSVSTIATADEAFELGLEHGRLLSGLGFNINFAPVADLEDNIWRCRSWSGSADDITAKIVAYITGLQSTGILATVKHFPGENLASEDPHRYMVWASVTEEDVKPFDAAIRNGVGAVMPGHVIVQGVVDSRGKPPTVSPSLIASLREEFGGLIVTDEIQMSGLRKLYDDFDEEIVDLFKAENDVILYFTGDADKLIRFIDVVERATHDGLIGEDRIDASVRRILQAKGLQVV